MSARPGKSGAGVLDELELHVVPVLFGQGRRLFEGVAAEQLELERTRILEGEGGVTHMHLPGPALSAAIERDSARLVVATSIATTTVVAARLLRLRNRVVRSSLKYTTRPCLRSTPAMAAP